MSIVKQIENIKKEMAALATCFEQGGVSITAALQKAKRYQELQRDLTDLRMNHQFATMVEIILGDGDKWDGPSSSAVGSRLHQFTFHIVSQLSPQASFEHLLDIIDGLYDFSEKEEKK